MGTWGPGNFENDAALDFLNEQVDSYVGIIKEIFGDAARFRLDEDAEGMLMPSLEILLALNERLHGKLPKGLDIAGWKSRYLSMYDEQIDGLEPDEGYKQLRRDTIATTFDKLLNLQAEQWPPHSMK